MRYSSRGRWAAALAMALLAFGRMGEAQQSSFEQTVADLTSNDRDVRRRAAEDLKESAFPEAALPLAKAVLDADDGVQHEAIMGELNVFLAERVVPRKRVGLVIEVRNHVSPRSIFERGWRNLDARTVPGSVLTALRSATHDDNAQIGIEALYAFGSLSGNTYGTDRDALLAGSAAELGALLGNADLHVREAAVMVVARMYERRPGEGPVDQALGDALVTTLNDSDGIVRRGAMGALGALRYERGVQALSDIVEHYERGPEAEAALSALARIAHPSSMPLFTSLLASRDGSLKASAIEGLARSGNQAYAAPIAEAVAKDRRADVQLAAHFADAILNEGSIDDLVEGLTRPTLHDRALRFLSEVAPGRSATFSPQLPDPKPSVRADLLDALGLSNDPDLASQAERLLNDPDPMVARTATRAVFRLKGQRAPMTRP